MALFRRARGDCPGCGKEARKDLGEANKAKAVTVTCGCGTTFKVSVDSAWWFSYRDPEGRFRRRRIGPDKQAAARAHSKVMVEIAEGRYIDRKATCRMTLAELLDKYLEHVKPSRKPDNHVREEGASKKLREVLGAGLSIDKVTEQTVEEYQAGRAGKAVATINRELSVLSAALTWAVKKHWIAKRPRFQLPTPKNEKTRFLTREESCRLVAACPPELRGFVQAALHTGMRRGELWQMTWAWVDFRRGLITIPPTATKNGEGRVIPFGASRGLRRVLEDARDRAVRDCPYVFHYEGQKLPKTLLGHVWRRTVEKAGLEGVRIHDLRHSFASRLAAAGVDLYRIALLLGHKDLKMTRRYSHLAPEHLQAAVALADFEEMGTAEDPPVHTRKVIEFPSVAKSLH